MIGKWQWTHDNNATTMNVHQRPKEYAPNESTRTSTSSDVIDLRRWLIHNKNRSLLCSATAAVVVCITVPLSTPHVLTFIILLLNPSGMVCSLAAMIIIAFNWILWWAWWHQRSTRVLFILAVKFPQDTLVALLDRRLGGGFQRDTYLSRESVSILATSFYQQQASSVPFPLSVVWVCMYVVDIYM